MSEELEQKIDNLTELLEGVSNQMESLQGRTILDETSPVIITDGGSLPGALTQSLVITSDDSPITGRNPFLMRKAVLKEIVDAGGTHYLPKGDWLLTVPFTNPIGPAGTVTLSHKNKRIVIVASNNPGWQISTTSSNKDTLTFFVVPDFANATFAPGDGTSTKFTRPPFTLAFK